MTATIWKYWTMDEDRIIRENLESSSNMALAKLLPGRTSDAIHARIALLGLRRSKRPTRENAWTEEEINRIRQTVHIISYRELALLFPGRTVYAVKQRAWQMGVHLAERPREFNSTLDYQPRARLPKRKINENFFSEKSLISAYWAGFLAADGCITEEPRCEIKFGIHQKDKSALERFVANIGYDGEIKNRKQMSHICICAAYKLVKDLREIYNIWPRKTFTLLPPNVFGDMALAYSVGYIDGDGCWAIKDPKTKRRTLSIVGREIVLSWLQKIWIDAGASTGNTAPRPHGNVWTLCISGAHADSIANLLGRLPLEKLERKWRVARGEAFGQERRKP